MYRALGVHVFAGGFTRGVQQQGDFDVQAQLEIHDLGSKTVEEKLGVPVIKGKTWQDWPKIQCDLLYGNPRCTGFSCLTAGYDGDIHGPWAKQTRDIHDLVEYAISLDPQPRVIVWESVQQAYSTGHDLLCYLKDTYFVPNGYNIAHLFINAATFGNAQQRKRYFFLAYKNDRKFNVAVPEIQPYRTILRDVIEEYQDRETRTFKYKDLDYTEDSWLWQNEDAMHCIELMQHGWNFNMFAKYRFDDLPERMKFTWKYRTSDMPFSMHCPYRVAYDVPAPTLWGACQYVHPEIHRLLTIKELSVIMGWDYTPCGPNPIGQIAKGIVPAVGTWLAEQAKYYFEDAWGADDFACKYDATRGEFVDALHTDTEKVFNITAYKPYGDKVYEEWVDSIKKVS